MIVDYKDADVPASLQARTCVIGAGPAGISLALEMASLGNDVLLLEGGGRTVSQEGQSFYDGDSIGRSYFPLISTRLRALGGSSGHWSGWCGPMDDLDFELRDWVPGSGWPIKRDEVLPWYQKAQTLFHIGPFEFGEDHWREEYSALPRLNDPSVLFRFLQVSAPPVNFGLTYADELERNSRITVLLHANATRLNLNPDGARVDTVEVESTTGKKGRVTAERFVVACGGIENARLLLASNDVSANGIGNDRDLVGRYFMEHIDVPCAHVYGTSKETAAQISKNISRSGLPLIALFCPSPEQQRNLRIANFSAFCRAPQFHNHTGWQAFVAMQKSLSKGRMPEDLGRLFKAYFADFDSFAGVVGLKLKGQYLKPNVFANDGVAELVTMSEQVPNPASRVILSNRKDPLGHPLAALDWQLSDMDHETIRKASVLIGAEINRTGFGRFRLHDWLHDEEAREWSPYTVGGWHHMGSTRMATSASDGVVDADCKVHGIDNVYLAGSSVFTTGSYVNPTLTIVALALRLANHLAKRG